MSDGFTTVADSGPASFNINSTPNDPVAVLPEGKPAAKMTALRQRKTDAHAATPSFETVKEAYEAVTTHQRRIRDLTTPKSAGGHGLPQDAVAVVHERTKLERAEAEKARLVALKDIRGERWTVVAQLERSVNDWVTRGGIHGECVLESVEDAPLSELLTKNDGGRIAEAVERYRNRLRELAADLHRTKSAPWPSSAAKAAVRDQINALAEAGTPDVDRAIEHGLPVSFKTTLLSAMVRGTDTPAIAHTETVDAFGLLCWTFRDQILAKVHAAIDEVADDKAAMNQQQREEREAQISADVLAVKRSECSLIWAAEAKGEVIDFRAETTPQAVLGVRLVTAPRANPSPGSSPLLAYDIVGQPKVR